MKVCGGEATCCTERAQGSAFSSFAFGLRKKTLSLSPVNPETGPQ
jgi:hypothetical protein